MAIISLLVRRESSFQIQGPRLFNCIPKSVRAVTKVSVDEFKQHLDKFLEKLPDETKVDYYIPIACNIVTASPSNYIVDLKKKKKGLFNAMIM